MPNMGTSNEMQGAGLPQRIHSPSRLVGLSLSDAFRSFVIEDPEVRLLGKIIVEQEGAHGEVFNHGQYPGPFVDFTWPLDATPSDLVFQFVRPVLFVFPGPPLPEGSSAVQRVSGLIAERLNALRRMLATGEIAAYGTFAKTGNFCLIHRLQWARPGLFIDVSGGDLLQKVDHKPVVLWSGVILEAPAHPTPQRPQLGLDADEFHVNSSEHVGLPSDPISTKKSGHPTRRITPQRASVQAAIAAIWPDGIPMALPLKTRDQKIIDWQKANALAVASSKTIGRYLAAKADTKM
jgi:hypothetical protein